MAEPADFLPYVQPFAQACPVPVAERFITEASEEFCRRTRIWRYVQNSMAEAGPFEPILMPPEASLHEIEGVWIDGQRLHPAPFDLSADGRLDYEGAPCQFTQSGPDRITLLPRGRGPLRIACYLKPQLDAQELPDFLLEHHAKVIGWGALREIFLLPNQPFSSTDAAGLYAQRFEGEVNRLFATNLRGQHRAPVRTRPRYF